jgi:hypothetical protein
MISVASASPSHCAADQKPEQVELPDQDWSLRVTLVFRRKGSKWRQVHRHADPPVHGISLEHAAAIARREASDTQ